MILSELNAYLAERQQVALLELAYRFHTDPEALRLMLQLLERKGRVRKLPPGSHCANGCRQCDPAALELYEWIPRASD